MRIYDIHNQHPEWVENPTEHQAEIREAAHAYIWDFFKMGADVRDRVLLRDLNAIAGNRIQILTYWEYNGTPEAEPTDYRQSRAKCIILERVFRLIVRYLAYYGYALQHEDLEAFYNGRDEKELNFIKFDEWQITEPNANKDFAEVNIAELHNMLYSLEHEKDSTPHINLGDKTATALFDELKGKIDEDKDNFLWYFGDDCHRTDTSQPKPITWYGGANEFAYLCLLIKIHLSNNDANYKSNIRWKNVNKIFTNGNRNDSSWENGALPNYVSGFRNKEKLPAKFELKVFSEELKALKQLRKKMGATDND